jgi:uncharacterized membrane protein
MKENPSTPARFASPNRNCLGWLLAVALITAVGFFACAFIAISAAIISNFYETRPYAEPALFMSQAFRVALISLVGFIASLGVAGLSIVLSAVRRFAKPKQTTDLKNV